MSKELTNDSSESPPVRFESVHEEEEPKRPWWHSIKEPGSALQIVIAAAVAIGIGMAVTTTVDDIPEAVAPLIGIPGTLWLRALKAVVLPLIVTAMILAVQNLREMTKGGSRLAAWTIGYYVATTVCAIIHSTIMVDLVWSRLMTVASEEAIGEEAEVPGSDDTDRSIHAVVVQMFESLIPANVVNALATDSLLSVVVMSIVVGYLIPGSDSSILRAVKEVEKMITRVIIFLINCAPIGVFFLILPNLLKLDIADIGRNLGVLIGAALAGKAIHLFIILPIIFVSMARRNPYTYWFKCSPAWITAWGSASSAATLPVSLKCARHRGVPETVSKFCVPLGCLINMDGTAIYFPVVVVFLAATQGHELSPVDYVIIVLLATLASIGTTPIPSSSLVLTVMIAESVNVPVTGMFAVVVAIDWFLDRFRTMVNVSGDLFGSYVVAKMTGITDPDDMEPDNEQEVGSIRVDNDNTQRV
ncbi:hypothetical protein VTO42DRAFT_8346 [Malbranchea cinnamomea]